jgi:hypothetical protein
VPLPTEQFGLAHEERCTSHGAARGLKIRTPSPSYALMTTTWRRSPRLPAEARSRRAHCADTTSAYDETCESCFGHRWIRARPSGPHTAA